MALQTTQDVLLGQIFATQDKAQVLHLPNIGASMVLIFYDALKSLAAVAHIILPDSLLISPNSSFGKPKDELPQTELPAKFADKAVPALMNAYISLGGDPMQVPSVRLVGGAQMFNFGGGSASLLNVGGRNAIAIQSALSKLGLPVHQKETGGNKIRNLSLNVANGQLLIQQLGEPDKTLL